MTTEDALLATILANPDDDTARLVYADWLDEHGRHEYAEFIRVQCELAATPEYVQEYVTAAYDTFFGELEIEPRNCNMRNWRHDALSKRERELIAHAAPWPSVTRPCDCGELMIDSANHSVVGRRQQHGTIEFRFLRGFAEGVTCAWEDWRDHGDAILAKHPVTKVRLTTPVVAVWNAWVREDAVPITLNGEAFRHPLLVTGTRVLLHGCGDQEGLSWQAGERPPVDADRSLLSARWPTVREWELPEEEVDPMFRAFYGSNRREGAITVNEARAIRARR